MIRWTMYWLAMILGFIGCGQEEASVGSGCETEPQSVTVSVTSSFPPLLEPSVCGAGSVSELEAFLLLPDETSCFLELRDAGIRGCCPVVNLNRSLSATVVVRTTQLEALFENTKLVSIPSTGGQVVDVLFDAASFDGAMYDADRDGEPNIDEYCSGSL
ncbi:MAG: hypothetical protein VX834_04395 [Myxococcota bacterium]|nr:hypothetical protein [Myxococcota bacterium]